ncbi:M20 metallopeptidase family protein [Streptomyces litchfieldiae]|uniref:M20/M25/M40 family metallo-hydrolase n=1 Tax=Streptomyces litchfieldiae TaxID=3075543 RepID=A0ABU2MJK8_9ACTN|nr:M20/M25/M40 family metallo-hydrolase [Streptomyces sp. DSM 44938]MDT0341622.1 M20/M25/M40 family metallo-hydrolase [Streptomyces sp. DSM 44938]
MSHTTGARAHGTDHRSIDSVAARLDDELIALRRDIHHHPEGPGEERRTAAIVADRLRAAGLAVTTGVGGRGVVGVLRGGSHRPGRAVAYRADMDAVPPKGQISGGGTEPAHLCGHDVNTTVGVGVAQVLARLRHRLSGTVMFIFQPAEESLTGARDMLDAGVLEGGPAGPEEIHTLHCGPFPVGQFGITPGTGMPGQDRGSVTLSGPGAAERARQLAAEINALATVTTPKTAADVEQLVADFQTPDGPLARFLFVQASASEKGVVSLSYRCWPEERYMEVRETIRGIAQRYDGAQVSFPDEPFPAMVGPADLGHAAGRYLRRHLGPDAVTVLHAAIPFSGEDFALFLDRVPGTYTFLGVRAPGAGITTSYPHFGDFDPDERAIGHGVRAMAGWLAERARRG